MSITDFIESLTKDRLFSLQVAEYRYIPPVEPKYGKLDLPDRLREVLRKRGVELFYSHQVEAVDLIRRGEKKVLCREVDGCAR